MGLKKNRLQGNGLESRLIWLRIESSEHGSKSFSSMEGGKFLD
jgi:hypothetical protein